MTRRSSVVLSHSELGDKWIWPQRIFQVPEDIGWWQINQTPCILFYLSPLQSNYLVDLAGLLEFHRVLCFLLDTTLCNHYLNTREGEGVLLFRKEIQQSRGQYRASLNRHWEATRSLNTQTFDSIVNVCGMAVEKRENVAVFPATLWTDRWDSSSQFHTLLFLTWMFGAKGGDELPKRIWRDVKDNTLNAIPCTKECAHSSHPKKPKFLKVIPAFLNLHMGSLHFAVILWSELFSHCLLRLLCSAASPISTARCSLAGCLNQAPWGSWCRSCDVQKIQSSPQTLASWSLLTPHLLQGGGSKSSLAPACSQASDLKEMGVLTDHGTRGYVIMKKYGRSTC